MSNDKVQATIDQFTKNASKAMHEDAQALKKPAKNKHDIAKGEYVEDVDPMKADKHLED